MTGRGSSSISNAPTTTNGGSIFRLNRFHRRPSTSFSRRKTRVSTTTTASTCKPSPARHGRISPADASSPAPRPSPCSSSPSPAPESVPSKQNSSRRPKRGKWKSSIPSAKSSRNISTESRSEEKSTASRPPPSIISDWTPRPSTARKPPFSADFRNAPTPIGRTGIRSKPANGRNSFSSSWSATVSSSRAWPRKSMRTSHCGYGTSVIRPPCGPTPARPIAIISRWPAAKPATPSTSNAPSTSNSRSASSMRCRSMSNSCKASMTPRPCSSTTGHGKSSRSSER